MFRNILTAASAGAALVAAAPLYAQAHGNGHAGGANSAIPAGPSMSPSMTDMDAGRGRNLSVSPSNSTVSGSTTTRFSTNSQALTRSQGPAHASTTGISHASPNSVLARGSVSAGALAGLTAGLTVNNSSGRSIGTVSQVVAGSDGSIRAVIVTSPTGQTFRLAPSSLSISGNVVTTTSATVGG